MIVISRRLLRSAALLTLLLPCAAFLLTWIRPVIALPATLALAAAFVLDCRRRMRGANFFGDDEDALHISIWVLAAVTLGGKLMGVVGMLFFIPLCSVLYALFRDFVKGRLAEKKVPVQKWLDPPETKK